MRRLATAALAASLLVLGCVPAATRPGPEEVDPPDLAVRLRVGADSRLRIGALPWFDYDGRAGWATGIMSPAGPPGRYEVRFPAEAVRIVPLPMIAQLPELPLRVTMRPNADLAGWVDLCSGAASLAFDATFQPEALGLDLRPLSVVTPLSTAPVGDLSGTTLDEFGRGRLVGVAAVPATGDVLVDGLLGLPTAAIADLTVDLDVTGEAGCPLRPTPPGRIRIETLSGAELDTPLGTVRADAPAILEADLAADGSFANPLRRPTPPTPAWWLTGWDVGWAATPAGRIDRSTRTVELTLYESIQPTIAGVPVGPPTRPGPLRGVLDGFGATVLADPTGAVRLPAVVDVVGSP
jgi:hypothetical protein